MTFTSCLLKCLLPPKRCSVCKAFKPKWELIGEKLKGKVLVTDFDCATYGSVCRKFGIKHYPTFFLFEDGKPRVEISTGIVVTKLLQLAAKKYKDDESDEDFEPLKDSTEEEKETEKPKSKKRSKRSAKPETSIKEIFGSNFKAATAGKVSLVSFCVPWCQSCQKIMSSMTELSHHFKESEVKLAHVDCNNDLNSDICFQELSNGVPLLNLYCNGEVRVKDFSGSSFEELKDMISSNCGDPAVAEAWKTRFAEQKHKHRAHN